MGEKGRGRGKRRKGGRKRREKGSEVEGREGGRLCYGFWRDGCPWYLANLLYIWA